MAVLHTIETHSFQPMFEFIPTELLVRIVDEMIKVHNVAREFHTNKDLRIVLSKLSNNNRSRPPNLQKQETHSIHTALALLFRLYSNSKPNTDQMNEFRSKLIR